MTRGQRRWHVWWWAALAAALPIGVLAAWWARAEAEAQRAPAGDVRPESGGAR